MELAPKDFQLEQSTIWSFPDRGSWATHSGKYRGNWSPYIPRNIILRYSKPGDIVLDQFAGSGTTLVEAKLLNRKGVGVDINPNALKIAAENSYFNYPLSRLLFKRGSATDLYFIQNETIDLICTHPPYAGIIKYSEGIAEDLSCLSVDNFLNTMKIVAKEAFRVLKKGRICAIMIGDIRKQGNVYPLGFEVMKCFLEAGFFQKEIIIKEQHNCRSTTYWKNQKNDFLLLAHEYIFVFQKQ